MKEPSAMRPRKVRYQTRVFALLLFGGTMTYSCGDGPQTAKIPEVAWRGALRSIMMEGNIDAVTRLDTLLQQPDLYALGAVEELRGEILVRRGRPTISIVAADTVRLMGDSTVAGAMLVYARVGNWQDFTIPDSVDSEEMLSTFVRTAATAAGIPDSRPFPFLLDGTARQLAWHVIDWTPGDTVHTHEKHKTSGARGILQDRDVEVLGFYSDRHHGIFTHRAKNTHMHFVTSDARISGHIDAITPGRAMTLRLPAPDR